jgi:hypothetical protein
MTRRVRPGHRLITRRLSRLATSSIVLLALSALAAPGAMAVTLTPAPPAGAECQTGPGGTVCSWTETFATPFPVPYGVGCGTFSVRVNLSGERKITAFYDANGTIERRIRHSSYVGTLGNSITGATVPHIGHFTIFDDFGAGTSTITGMLSRTVVDGEGLVWRNIGRIELSLSNGTVLAEAGEHGTWDVVADPSVATELCAALA